MEVKEFRNLKVGDKVQIVSNKIGDDWDPFGEMVKWLGKIMTIREIDKRGRTARMKEDKNEAINGWFWYPHMIEKKVEECPTTVVEHLIKGRKTIVKLSTGKVGIAVCSPEDTFNPYEGFRLASARAYGYEDPYEKRNTVKEVKRTAKVGEYIKITNGISLYEAYYKNGDILKVYKRYYRKFMINNHAVTREGVFCELNKKVFNLDNDNGNPVIFDEEYVVLEGYKPKKEPSYKEVNRIAKGGDYIKITKPNFDFEKVGDILKVCYEPAGVHYTDYPSDRHVRKPEGVYPPCWYHLPNQYVVLEGYKPKKENKK